MTSSNATEPSPLWLGDSKWILQKQQSNLMHGQISPNGQLLKVDTFPKWTLSRSTNKHVIVCPVTGRSTLATFLIKMKANFKVVWALYSSLHKQQSICLWCEKALAFVQSIWRNSGKHDVLDGWHVLHCHWQPWLFVGSQNHWKPPNLHTVRKNTFARFKPLDTVNKKLSEENPREMSNHLSI